MSFTNELENHLKKMGWYQGRNVTDYDVFMEQYDYPEFIKTFLREFGGLKIKDLNPQYDIEKFKKMDRTFINPLLSDGMDSDSVAEDWSRDLGRELYVIGLYLPENYDIAVDENGAVYLLGEYCQCVGKDIYKGLESIIRIDQWSQLEVDATDTASGKWLDVRGKEIDFDDYEFQYKLF